MPNMSTAIKEDLHHPVPKSGYTSGGLGGLGLLGAHHGSDKTLRVTEGVSLGPESRVPIMSGLMHGHQAPRAHSPPLSAKHQDGSSNKRIHSGNKAQANADLTLPQLCPTSLQGHRLTRRINIEKKDPLSHRIIEKRRRDRMNNCLADLSRLIPAFYTKKGRGRIEKTEIIEMAIKYMKHLKAHECQQLETCELTESQKEPPEGPSEPQRPPNQTDLYHMGYQDCINETMHFLNESEGLYPGDSLCVRLLNHLNKHQNDLMGGDVTYSRAASGASSSSSGYHANGSSTCSSDGNGNSGTNSSDNKDTDITEESAYRSEDQPFPEDQDDKSSSRYDANQLRDMLQRESYQYLGGSDLGPEFTSGSYSQGLSSNNSSSGDDNGARLYKFKSNMKNRFTTDLEHSHQVRKRRRDSESSCGNYTDYEKDCGTPTGLSCQPHNTAGKVVKRVYQNSPLIEKSLFSLSTSQKGISRKPIKEELIPGTNDVPIFALNKNGSFYIPLTIDHSLIAKGMARIIETTPVLHPVSIFVNFSVPSSNESDVKFDNPYPSKQLPNISRDGEADNRIPELSHDRLSDVCRDSQLSKSSYNDLKLRSGNQSLNVEESENFDKKELEKNENCNVYTEQFQQTLVHPSDIPHDTCHELPREHHKSMELRQGDHLPQGLRERIEPHFNDHQLPQEHRDGREHREHLHHPDQYELQERHKLSQIRVRREQKQSSQNFTDKHNYSNSSSYSRAVLPNWLQHNYQVKKL